MPSWRTWTKGWSKSFLKWKLLWSLTSLEWKLWLSKVSCNPAMFECCKWMICWAELIIVSVSIGWLLISFKSPYVRAKRGDGFSPPSSSDSILNICSSRIFVIKEVTFDVACNPFLDILQSLELFSSSLSLSSWIFPSSMSQLLLSSISLLIGVSS